MTSAPARGPSPRAGSFAESAALVVADHIAAERSRASSRARHTRAGAFATPEFGNGLVSRVEVNFLGGPSPVAARNEPSLAFAAEKAEFGATRRARSVSCCTTALDAM